MISSQNAPLLSASLTRDLGAIVEAVLTELAGRDDVYGALPPEALTGDIALTVERNVRLFVGVLTTGRLPTGAQLDEIKHSAARRAEERVPLDVMLRAYLVATRVVFERTLSSTSVPLTAPDVVAVGALVLDYLGEILSASTGGYLDEHQMIVGAAQTDEQRNLDALLAGDPTRLTGDLAHVEMPDEIDVVVLEIAAHPDEIATDIDAAIAARRKLRRVRTALRSLSSSALLSSLSPRGGVALVPSTIGDERLVEAVSDAAGVAVTIAISPATPVTVPAAVQEARDVLDIVRWIEGPPGAYRLADVVVEYQITRPGPARAALAATLAPIVGADALTSTLRAFLRHGGNRRRVALDEHVHPNTVDYRMAKVHRLTGYDPTASADAFRLRTALVALDAERASV